jgi:hypothetical protein
MPASLAQFALRLKEALSTLKQNSFLTEQCGDVIENKGGPLITRRRSENVSENKGDAIRKRECC